MTYSHIPVAQAGVKVDHRNKNSSYMNTELFHLILLLKLQKLSEHEKLRDMGLLCPSVAVSSLLLLKTLHQVLDVVLKVIWPEELH